MTDKEFFNLKSGDRIKRGDGIIITVKAPQINKRNLLGMPIRMSYLVSFDNGWPEFVYSYERGSDFSSWELLKSDD